ncbi:MAG: sulfurtransferase, partial [Gammaproteobacteria bacterium]|nr:sulfurtransferase [Gammaproteobacteria bacterium]
VLGDDALLVVDLCNAQTSASAQVPGAIRIEYASIIASRPPVSGLLPDAGTLARVMSSLGLAPDRHVVAYDDEGGGKAGRLVWTLHMLGHERVSMLDGGIHAWANEGHAIAQGAAVAAPSEYDARIVGDAAADKDYILARLDDAGVVLVDTRTPEEYHGVNVRAERGGHIPGAINFNWVEAIDQARNLRMKQQDALRSLLESAGITPDREVIAYCQTHHRSSHTYVALKSLGYERVKGYPGAWSEWGNLPDTPIEK